MDCIICLEDINQGDELFDHVQFCCRQNYHFQCLQSWIKLHYTCPICRKVLTEKVMKIFRNIENNFKELKIKQERALHIIETLMLDIESVKSRTKNNLEKIKQMDDYIRPEIPPAPRLNLLNSRLYQRRNAIIPRFISNNCAAPAFCRCFHCLSPIEPRWN